MRLKINRRLFANLHGVVVLRNIFVVVLTIYCLVFGTCVAYAGNESAVQSKGLTLSPLRSEFNIAPGTSHKGSLTVTNSSGESIDVKFNANEFSVINQQYDYAFTEESEVSKWIVFETDEVTLKANETKKIFYDIGVPQSAEPGGRYVSLFASTGSRSSEKGIVSEQRIASLLYITVTGEVSRIGSLMSLASPWYVTKNGQWSVLLSNKGTTHYRSRYNVTFYDPFGQIASESKTGESLILPGTARLVTDSFSMPKWPGLYKVVYVIGLGDTPAEITVRYMLYLPVWAVIAIISAFVGLIIYLKRRFVRRKNQSV